MTSAGVTAVVPVKGLSVGKSRLALPAAQRRELTGAFAVDVVSALHDCSAVGEVAVEVVVVTGDPDVERLLRPLGVRLVADPGGGLPAAVLAGAWTARPGNRLLVVPADLPFLAGADLAALLADHDDGFVPDRSGTGTTLLLRPAGALVDPQYGPGSADRHARLGLPRLGDVPVGLRHDVDTLEDLVADVGERLSPRTRQVLGRLREQERRAG